VAIFSANILIIGWFWSIVSKDSTEFDCRSTWLRDDVASGGRGGTVDALAVEDDKSGRSLTAWLGGGNPDCGATLAGNAVGPDDARAVVAAFILAEALDLLSNVSS